MLDTDFRHPLQGKKNKYIEMEMEIFKRTSSLVLHNDITWQASDLRRKY